jgi:hypothetical protein
MITSSPTIRAANLVTTRSRWASLSIRNPADLQTSKRSSARLSVVLTP